MKKITINLKPGGKQADIFKSESFSHQAETLEVESLLINEIKNRQRRLRPNIWKK